MISSKRILSFDKKVNGWLIGGPPDVQSPEHTSDVLLVGHTLKPDQQTRQYQKQYHYHTEPIEEVYLVIKGWIDLNVRGQIYRLEKNQLFKVNPHECHNVRDMSQDVHYLTIRAPKSDSSTRILCEE